MGRLELTPNVGPDQHQSSSSTSPDDPVPPPAATAPPQSPRQPANSPTTDPPDAHNASNEDPEAHSTSAPTSPTHASASSSSSINSHINSELAPAPPLPPLLHNIDDIESRKAASFPPAPATGVFPDRRMVVFVPPGNNDITEAQMGQNGPGLVANTGAPFVGVDGNAAPVAAAAAAAFSAVNNEINPAQTVFPGPKTESGCQQPEPGMPSVVLVPFIGVPWKSGLFDCCQQPTNAIITTVAPCVTFGQIAEILDNGSTSCLTGAFLYFFVFLVLCHWNIGRRYRRRLRNAFQIAETPVTDKMAHAMFPLCALCQEFRELQYRGLDPFQGYQGVIAGILHEQRQQSVDNIPPTSQVMMR